MKATITASPPRVSLERQVELMRQLDQRTAPSSLIGLDLNGDIRSFSKSAQTRYGYSDVEVLGVNAGLLEDPNAPRAFARALDHAKLAGKWAGVLSERNRNGHVLLTELTLLLLRDAAGKPANLVAIGRDIQEARRIEREHALALEAGARWIESSVELLLLANSAGAIVDANALARAALGAADGTAVELTALLREPERARHLIEATLARDELHGESVTLTSWSGVSVAACCDTLAVVDASGVASHLLIAARPRDLDSARGFGPMPTRPGLATTRATPALRVA
jgi:PAS domain S-box-containing protein